MKVYKYILTSLAAAAVGAVTGCIIQSTRNMKNSELPVLHGIETKDEFIIKDHDGFLALYRQSAESPYLILDYRTSYLNEYDRTLVIEGISVPTEKEMNILIEDLTG